MLLTSTSTALVAHAFVSVPAKSFHLVGERLLTESSLISPRRRRCTRPLHAMKDNGPLNMIPPITESASRIEKVDATSHAMEGDRPMSPMSFDPFNLAANQETENEESAQLSIWAARALLLAVAILWGTNFASVKYLENLCFHPPCVHPPSEAALARFGVAGLVSIPFLLHKRKDIIIAGFECGVWITLGYVSQALALSTISSGKCAFICSLTVVVVPLIEALFFGKAIKPVNLVSGALAIVGVGILEGMVDFNELLSAQPALADATSAVVSSTPSNLVSSAAEISTSTSSTSWLASLEATLGVSKGDILALGQPFGFGIAFMRIEHYVEKFKEDKNRIMTLSAAQCVIVGILSLFWVLIDFHGHVPNMQYMVCLKV